MSRKKISTTVYLDPEQDAALKRLSAHTRVPVAEYVREGINLALRAHSDELPPAHPYLIGDRGGR